MIKKLKINQEWLRKLSIIMVLGVQLLTAAASFAQSTDREWRLLVIRYLAHTARNVLPGYRVTSNRNGEYNIDTGRLLEGQVDTYNISIGSSNRRKAFLAVCDNYCSDIDLRAYKNGRLMAEDISSDDYPVILIEPGFEGRVQIRITMVDCSTSDACYYGVGLLER